MKPDGSAYWSTVAQLCPILGVAVVIEARRFILNTTKLPRRLRALQGVVLAGAALALVQSLFQSLRELSTDPTDLFWSTFVTNLLVYVAAALISNPVIDAVWASNADTVVAVWFAIRHPVAFTQARVGSWQVRRRIERVVEKALAHLESTEGLFADQEESMRRSVALVAAWGVFAAIPDDKMAEAMAAVPPPPELAGLSPSEINAKVVTEERDGWALLSRLAEAVEAAWDGLIETVDLYDEVVDTQSRRAAQYSQILNAALEKAISDLQERLSN